MEPGREQEIVVNAPDRKRIYCVMGLPARKPQGMVVFVHGLASTAYWPPMLLGSWYLRSRGYGYCRINLCDWRPKARSLMRSDLLQHSKDTDAVVRYLKRRGHSKLFAVGHSFGGLTLLQADCSDFRAMSLWDCSSFMTYNPADWLRRDRRSGATYMTVNGELLMSARYIRGMLNFPNELELAARLPVPTQICYAAGKRGLLVESSQRYYKALRVKRRLTPIQDADHSFTEEATSRALFQATERWFQNFL